MFSDANVETAADTTPAAQPVTEPVMEPVTAPGRYNPERLLDAISQTLSAKNDAALARLLEVAGPVIHRIRRRHTPVRASLLVRMQEASGLSLKELRTILGDKRKTFRMM